MKTIPQILAGGQATQTVDSSADIDGDGKLGQAEVIYTLQHNSP